MNTVFRLSKFRYQNTISNQGELLGKGPFTGKVIKMRLVPASADTGLIIKSNGREVKVCVDSLVRDEVRHTTSVFERNVKVSFTEHLLAALYAFSIDNLIIDLGEGEEIPAVDSSSEGYSNLLAKLGKKKQRAYKMGMTVDQPYTVYSETKNNYIRFLPCDNLRIEAGIDFSGYIGIQSYVFNYSKRNFLADLCWARSFIRSSFSSEDPEKWDRIRSDMKSLPKNIQDSPLILYDDMSFITPVRYDNEPVRHKILDFLGDWNVTQWQLRAKIVLNKPGHQLNRKAIMKVYEEVLKSVD